MPEALTVPVTYCAVCDQDRPLWTVPGKPCRHSGETHRRIGGIDVVPLDQLDALAGEWRSAPTVLSLAASWARREAERLESGTDGRLADALDRIAVALTREERRP